jgi:hypothetical protein
MIQNFQKKKQLQPFSKHNLHKMSSTYAPQFELITIFFHYLYNFFNVHSCITQKGHKL